MGVERIFSVRPDEIVIPINGEINFDQMVERFEDVQEKIGGSLDEDDTSGYIEYTTPDRTKLIISMDENALILKPRGSRTIKDMLAGAQASVLALAKADQPPLLE